MAWLPDGEKNFDDMFIRFDTTHKRDDRHRHTHLQLLEISWNLKTLLEISWNLNGPPGNFCVMIEN